MYCVGRQRFAIIHQGRFGGHHVTSRHESDRDYRRHLRNEKKCKAFLVKHIADNQLEYIKDKLIAKDIFDTLEQVFERKSVANQLYLRKKFVTLKYYESGHIKTHLLEFDKIVRELKSTGVKLEEMDVICQLLLSLPKAYNSLVTAIETLHLEMLNMDFVRSRLLDEYCKRNGENMMHNSKSYEVGASAMACFKYKCYNRGKLGHKRTECPSACNFLPTPSGN